MSTIAGMLGSYPPLSQLDGAALETLAKHSSLEHFDAGARVLRIGDPANTFYVVVSGRVALEMPNPRGGSIIIETLGPGEVVGISWMLPPYRLTFDARCIEHCSMVAIDAEKVRTACDGDPAFGYAVHKQLSGVVRDRLQATRMQVLDLYGATDGS